MAFPPRPSGTWVYGVTVDGERWFVKHAEGPDGKRWMESARRFHREVRHPSIVPLRGIFGTPTGLCVVFPWVDGEVLNDAAAPGAVPRDDPASALSRFRALGVGEIVAALTPVVDAHEEIARRGFVAVDFYDGSMIYDFARHRIHLCDLDLYRPGPYVLDVDRQYGSSRFMAPEEWQRGAVIDERTTVYTLGRAAFLMLSLGRSGEQDRDMWRGPTLLYEVAARATRADPAERYQTVTDFAADWRRATR